MLSLFCIVIVGTPQSIESLLRTFEENYCIQSIVNSKSFRMSTIYIENFTDTTYVIPDGLYVCEYIHLEDICPHCADGKSNIVLNPGNFYNFAMGLWYFILGTILVLLYIPCLVALCHESLWKSSCYKLLTMISFVSKKTSVFMVFRWTPSACSSMPSYPAFYP